MNSTPADTKGSSPLPHVLIIVENLPVPLDYRVWRIATTLRANQYAVSVISPATAQYPPGEYELDGITILRHSMPIEARSLPQYILEYSAALWHEFRLSLRVYRRAPFHIIHACNPPDLIWLVALFWRLRGVKFVYDHHDLCPELLLAKSTCTSRKNLSLIRSFLYSMLRMLERISHALAHAVLATNDSYRRIALTRNHCSEEKVFTVRTGPLESELPEIPSGQTPAGPPQLAYVGVMAAQDGVDILISALHIVRAELHWECSLLLIGSGPERDALEKLCRVLDLTGCVTFTGFLPRPVVFEHLNRSIMGITPDPPGPMNDASTMLKALDYMSCGLPQVMFDLTENRATAGDSALYAEPGSVRDLAEKIVQLLADPALRATLSSEARSRIRSLTWEACGAPNLLKAYQHAVR